MRKLFVIFLVMLLYFSCVTIANNNLIAKASSGENYYLDQDYIYNLTKDLSNIINDTDIYPIGTIAKGRWFGTKGEHKAAEILADQMELNLGLIDPTDENSSGAYLEQIRDLNLNLQEGLVANETGNSGIFTEQYEITSRGLILNHSGNKSSVDCFTINSVINKIHIIFAFTSRTPLILKGELGIF